ncbi:G protein-coupled glucose receptor regulating Gpa2-domain-containing protein [Xylaria digitata]|nr:G protein-coupled glucose receptor regulating Gpa2-domain-containing protein [Xylaria digitata]
MAPLQQPTAADAISYTYTPYDGFTTKRDITEIIDPIDSQTLAVMCVSLSLAAISVMSAIFAFYWFVRMRRGFRQDMIMLLIQSDMAKALWLLISPLFYFITQKPFNSNWAFCQVSGFFLTVAIEASDIAVLLIAIHTALFFVKRHYPGATFGLQPYRRVAYTLWATVPIILAAIVPITGSSFVDNGPHCYLPIQPSWYRSALAWVPRYIIFGFIIVTYTGLYLYVYIRFRRFGEDQRRASTLNSESTGSPTRRQSKRKWRSRSVPPTPSLATHGLLDSMRVSISKNDQSKLRQYSVASTVSTLQIGDAVCLPAPPERVVRKSSIAWNLIDFGHDGAGTSASTTPHTDTIPNSPTAQAFALPSADISDTANSTVVTAAAIPVLQPTYAASSGGASLPSSRGARRSKWKRRLTIIRSHNSGTGSRNSLANIIAALRQGPPPVEHAGEEGAAEEQPSISSSSVHLPPEESEEAMRRSRDRMQRQMRLLFVYPMIYLLTWIAPFVAHVYRYDDVYTASSVSSTPAFANSSHHYERADFVLAATSQSSSHTTSEPLALRIVSMASLCIGAAVDCGFFSAWERPWKHLRGGFWEGLAMRLRFHWICGDAGERTGGPGRSRDERVADERAARMRRDREREIVLELRCKMAAAAAASSGSAGQASSRSQSGEGGTIVGGGEIILGRRREWWDVLDEAAL